MSKIYACQGKTKEGKKCMELFEGTEPKACPVCGCTVFRRGLNNMSYEQKQIWQQIERTRRNEYVTRGYRLKKGH